MRTPPLLADFSHARACKPFCENSLTLPVGLICFPFYDNRKGQICRFSRKSGPFAKLLPLYCKRTVILNVFLFYCIGKIRFPNT